MINYYNFEQGIGNCNNEKKNDNFTPLFDGEIIIIE